MVTLNGKVEIELNAENGIYTFNNWSGTGKTYLYRLLKAHQVTGGPVVAYTYDDYISKANLRSAVNNVKPTVIILDRADLYGDAPEIVDVVRKYSSKAIILVDKKFGEVGDTTSKYAGIRLEKGKITVTG